MANQIEYKGKMVPYYWHQHEIHKIAEKASNALFDLQNIIQSAYSTEDYKDDVWWRDVYTLRCKVGRIARNVQLKLGYKDGSFIPPS